MTQQSLQPDQAGGYHADLAAMRRDADSWTAAKEQMSGALSAAHGAALSTSSFSWVGGDTGLTEAYNLAHQWAVGLLEGAVRNCGAMSEALYSAADQYEQQETATTEKLKLKAVELDGGK